MSFLIVSNVSILIGITVILRSNIFSFPISRYLFCHILQPFIWIAFEDLSERTFLFLVINHNVHLTNIYLSVEIINFQRIETSRHCLSDIQWCWNRFSVAWFYTYNNRLKVPHAFNYNILVFSYFVIFFERYSFIWLRCCIYDKIVFFFFVFSLYVWSIIIISGSISIIIIINIRYTIEFSSKVMSKGQAYGFILIGMYCF